MQTRVQNNGELSEPFEVTNEFKQGCVMAPTLFSMMFSAMLMDGNKTKVTDVLDELLYADDMDKNASSEAQMH